MIEQEMVFALGFFTAGLLALACLPAVWRRAIRLTTRRLTRLAPLSMDEILAERDGLRACFAVEQRRLEQKMEAIEARRARVMVELGRRDVSVATLQDEGAVLARDLLALGAERDETRRELIDVRVETGTAAVALHDLSGLVDRQRWEVLSAEETARRLQSVIDKHRATIASLETRILGLDARIEDLDRALGNTRAELARTVQAVLRASGERDDLGATLATVRGERDALRADVTRLEAVVESKEFEAAHAMRSAAASQATIDDLRSERQALDAQLSMLTEAAENAAVRLGEVEAAAFEKVHDDDLDALRETLRRVADDVLRLTERAEGQSSPAAAGLSLPT